MPRIGAGPKSARRGRGKKLLPEQRDAIVAMMAERSPGGGTKGVEVVARMFGVHRATVRRLASRGEGLDGERVAAIRRTLPNTATVLAAAHAEQALRTVATDPGSSVKSTFGMKLALEGAGLARPQAAQPGVQVLAFVQQLTVGGPPERAENEQRGLAGGSPPARGGDREAGRVGGAGGAAGEDPLGLLAGQGVIEATVEAEP